MRQSPRGESALHVVHEVGRGVRGSRHPWRCDLAGALIPLPDLVCGALVGVGFSLQEHIRLARPAAYGHHTRSGHFKRYGGRAGYFLPDNVCSTLIIAFKGDPLARLRADATGCRARDCDAL